jgi:uncharacterized membrane protein
MDPLPTWKSFAIELLLYSVLIVGYFFCAMHYMAGWFKELYDQDRKLFAVMALVVMIGQTVGLEIVCGFLIWLVRGKKKTKK